MKMDEEEEAICELLEQHLKNQDLQLEKLKQMCNFKEFHKDVSKDIHESFQEFNKKLEASLEKMDWGFSLWIRAFNGETGVLMEECFNDGKVLVQEEHHLLDKNSRINSSSTQAKEIIEESVLGIDGDSNENAAASSISWLDENKVLLWENGENTSSICQIDVLESETVKAETWRVINGYKGVLITEHFDCEKRSC